MWCYTFAVHNLCYNLWFTFLKHEWYFKQYMRFCIAVIGTVFQFTSLSVMSKCRCTTSICYVRMLTQFLTFWSGMNQLRVRFSVGIWSACNSFWICGKQEISALCEWLPAAQGWSHTTVSYSSSKWLLWLLQKHRNQQHVSSLTSIIDMKLLSWDGV